jgi:hypothetical protein
MRYWSFLGGLLLVLPIAGCNFFGNQSQVYGDAPATSLRGQCERAAYDDPAVKTALANEAGTGGMYDYWAEQLQSAKLAAVKRCVQQRGGGGETGGGVELPNS